MNLVVILSGLVMLAFAAWGIYLRINHVPETQADREGWYESRIGLMGGGGANFTR